MTPSNEETRVHLDGTYELRRIIGRGGMATVYEGIALDRPGVVAIKVLKAKVSDQTTLQRQFLNELLLASHVRHPRIVEIYDFGVSAQGQPYIVMEMLQGRTLLQEIRRNGRFGLARGIRRMIEAAQGVEAAHAQGVIHADLKPNNLFLRHAGSPVESTTILDFGVARRREGPPLIVGGTPRYMPPEVLRGAPPQPRSDVYQLGMVLAEMLAGRALFDAKTTRDCLAVHATGPVPLPAEVEQGPLGLVIRSALQADPRRRLGTAAELRAALELTLHDIPATDGLGGAETELSEPLGSHLSDVGHTSPRSLFSGMSRSISSRPPVEPLQPAERPPPPRRDRERLLIVALLTALLSIAFAAGVFLAMLSLSRG